MNDKDYRFHFTAKATKLDFGRMAYHVVYVPRRLQRELAAAGESRPRGRLRIDGEINGHRFAGALQPGGGGTHYLMLSRRMMRLIGAREGDQVTVDFRLADPEAVDVPRELALALAADPVASRAWDEMTAGKRRGFAHMVDSAKRPSTRAIRVENVLDALRLIGRQRDATSPDTRG